MKITNRDVNIFLDCSNNIVPSSHLARRYFPSQKKCSHRMKELYEEGYVKRFASPFVSGNGKGEFIYYSSAKGRDVLRQQYDRDTGYLLNPLKDAYTIPHRLMVAEFQTASMFKQDDDYKASFLYPRETKLRAIDMGGLIPDGILVVEKLSISKALLMFLEVDMGTEPLAGDSSNSLRQKLERYSACFDSPDTQRKINDALGHDFQGFRVLFTVGGKRRLDNILLLCEKLQIEFIWITQSSNIKSGQIFDPVWGNYKFQNLSLIAPYPGRDLGSDLGGDLPGDSTPR